MPTCNTSASLWGSLPRFPCDPVQVVGSAAFFALSFVALQLTFRAMGDGFSPQEERIVPYAVRLIWSLMALFAPTLNNLGCEVWNCPLWSAAETEDQGGALSVLRTECNYRGGGGVMQARISVLQILYKILVRNLFIFFKDLCR